MAEAFSSGGGRSRKGELAGDRIPLPFCLPSLSHGIGPGDQQRLRRAEQSTQMQVQEEEAAAVEEER